MKSTATPLNTEQKKVMACFVGSDEFRAALLNDPRKTLSEWKFDTQAIGDDFVRRLETIDADSAVQAVHDAYASGDPDGC